jgi:hypothetical protein
MSDPIVFSGPVDMSQATFDKHYRKHVAAAISDGYAIRVGCALGCDQLVQRQCAEAGYYNVEVYIPSEAKQESVCVVSEKFRRVEVQGGFKKRDRAMCVGCKDAYGHISQYAGAASGTAANLITCAAHAGVFGKDCVTLDGYAVVDFLRKHLATFSATLQAQIALAEAENDAKE